MRNMRFWPHTQPWYEKFDTGLHGFWAFFQHFIRVFLYNNFWYAEYAV